MFLMWEKGHFDAKCYKRINDMGETNSSTYSNRNQRENTLSEMVSTLEQTVNKLGFTPVVNVSLYFARKPSLLIDSEA